MKIVVGKIPFPLTPGPGITYCCTVNCVGVMGKGVAKDFAGNVPGLYADYARRCARLEVRPGVPYLWTSTEGVAVAMLPTKDHWRNPARMEWVIACLAWCSKEPGLLHMPLPGCGCGGLDPWSVYVKIAEMRRVWDVALYVEPWQLAAIQAQEKR